MTQANSDTVPSEQPEITAMIVWPTIGATALGRWVGRMCGVRIGFGGFFTLGKLFALATIPISLGVFAWQLMPLVCRRFVLTDRRIVVQKGLAAVDERSIGLDEFDAIDPQVLPGQQWLHAGELVFKREGTEVFRLSGVSRPEVFRRVCLEVRQSLISVREVVQQQAVS